MIIGQQVLLSKIEKIIDSYPKFSIIVGPKGSGKKEVCKYICHKLNLPIAEYTSKIDDVRDCISLSYSQIKPICYLFDTADDMSVGAKNCLLKITEEPPKNAYFILNLTSIDNTLETLKSRGTVLTLDNYTKDELITYRQYKGYNGNNDELMKKICDTTGEVDILFKTDIPGFYSYVKSLFDYIHVVNTGNLFKVTQNLKLKEIDNGYDPFLVFKLLRNMYIEAGKETKKYQYLEASKVTTQCLQDLNINTISKLSTVDNWIFQVRIALRGI